MAEYKKLSARECAEAILKTEHPIVIMHVRPDGDTVGSAASLMYIFHKLGKAPLWACSDPLPERLEFLMKDYREAYRYEYDSSSVVTVDIPTKEQIGDIYDFLPSVSLMIDHHEVGVPFADNFIIPGASSAGEVVMLVAEELIEMGKLKLDEKLAYSLYAAISSDTGCLRYSNTTPDTLRRVATLVETGIDYADINHRLFNSKTPRQIRAEGFVAERINMALSDKVAYATVTKREREALDVLMEHFETAIDVVRSVEFIDIAFVIKETDKGEYKASLRSAERDVAKICAHFGGGGHVRAAGCTIFARSIDEAARKLLLHIERTYYSESV
ncbi:MAG: DHH family phosphoesterase [Clostridia bacterium]|nr:DHH family phosphoesterase [Clostridia bacterium]